MKLLQDFGVRALLGTIIVAPAVGALVYLAVKGSTEAMTSLGIMATAVIAFYFGQRSKT